jgi:hypothetical protein
MRPSPRWSAASASAWGELVTARLPGVGDQGPRPDLLHVREAGVRPVDLRLDLCLQRRVRREDFQRDGRVDMMLPPVGLKSLGGEPVRDEWPRRISSNSSWRSASAEHSSCKSSITSQVCRSGSRTETQKRCGSRSSPRTDAHGVRSSRLAASIHDRSKNAFPLPAGVEAGVMRPARPSRLNNAQRDTIPSLTTGTGPTTVVGRVAGLMTLTRRACRVSAEGPATASAAADLILSCRGS